MKPSSGKTVAVRRKSKETEISLRLGLEPGKIEIDTGIGFLDHMLESLAKHGGFSLDLRCRGDLGVDDHHSAEDCAIALGKALAMAGQARGGIKRFGFAYAPLDEALARAVVDFSGRPWCEADLGLSGQSLGSLRTENAEHFFQSLAANAEICLHVDVLKGKNDHHRLEAAFKALALALRQALEQAGGAASETGGAASEAGRPESTKGAVSLEVWVEEGGAADA